MNWNKKQEAYLLNNYSKLTARQIGQFLGKSLESVRAKAFRLGIKSNYFDRITYKVNLGSFSVPNLINSYWAGFLAADAHINHTFIRLELSSKDEQHLLKFKNFVQFQGPVYRYKNKKRDSQSIRISSCQKIIKELNTNFDISFNKSQDLKFPSNLDTTLVKAFLVGFIDGDGCIQIAGKNNGYPYLTLCLLGTKNFLEQFKKFCKKEYDIDMFNRKIVKKGKIHSLHIGGKMQKLYLQIYIISQFQN